MLSKILGGASLVLIIALAATGKFLLDAKQENGALEQANAGLEQAVEVTANRMAEYAIDVEGQLSAYEMANAYLLERDREAEDEAAQAMAVFEDDQFTRMLEENPADISRLANRATTRLLADIEAASRGSTSRKTSPASAPNPRPPDTDPH